MKMNRPLVSVGVACFLRGAGASNANTGDLLGMSNHQQRRY